MAAAAAQRVRSATNVISDPGRVDLKRTPSNKHIVADAKQLVFKTSSLALLKAKGHSVPGSFPGGEEGTIQSSYLKGAKLVLDYMNELWQTQRLCDVIIPVDKGEIRAHKIALGAYSDSLTRKFSEFPQGEVMCIDMSDFSRATIHSVLGFLYTTEINITQENVGGILRCSSELGIDVLIHICKNYLNNLNVDNALPYYSIAETHKLDDIRHSIYSYICDRFADITKTESFRQVPFDKMVTLICEDNIFGSELEVFQAVVRWVNYNRAERMSYAPSLLRCVRFHKISPEELVTKVETVTFIFEPRECFNILYEAMKYHALMLSGSSLANSFPVQRNRSGTTIHSRDETLKSTSTVKYMNNSSSHYTKQYVSALSKPPPPPPRQSSSQQPQTPPPPPPLPAQSLDSHHPQSSDPSGLQQYSSATQGSAQPHSSQFSRGSSITYTSSLHLGQGQKASEDPSMTVTQASSVRQSQVSSGSSIDNASQPVVSETTQFLNEEPTQSLNQVPAQSLNQVPTQSLNQVPTIAEPGNQPSESEVPQVDSQTGPSMTEPSTSYVNRQASATSEEPTIYPDQVSSYQASPSASERPSDTKHYPSERSSYRASQDVSRDVSQIASQPATAQPSVMADGKISHSMASGHSMNVASEPASPRGSMLRQTQDTDPDHEPFTSSQPASTHDNISSRSKFPPSEDYIADSNSQSQHEDNVPFQASETFRSSQGSVLSTGPPPNSMVMVGGVDLQSLDPDVPGRCVFSLSTETQDWEELGSLDEYTHHHGVAVVNGNLYVIGGAIYDYKQPDMLGGATKTVYTYYLDSETWEQVSSMSTARAYFQTATHNGMIYAVGGEDEGRVTLDSIEQYNPVDDVWRDEIRMPVGGFLGSAVTAFKDKLYVVGGYQRAKPANIILSSVECYDFRTHEWIDRHDLVNPRCHAGLVVVQDNMYLVAGRCKAADGLRSLATIERYNENNDIWEHVTDLHDARHDAGVTAVGNCIYIVGGMQTPSPYCLDTVECYDVTDDHWEPVFEMPYPAAGVATVAMYLPEMQYSN